MSDQIKISASLQDAQVFIAECLEFVTQDEPFVLDFYGEDGCYVQAIRGSSDEVILEVSGPGSVNLPISQTSIEQLVRLGWGLPHEPEANTPNFWREYDGDEDFKAIAKDAIIAVALCFPNATFNKNEDSYISMDELAEQIELGEKGFAQPVDVAVPVKKKKRAITSAWQDYDSAKFRCSDCKQSWLGRDVEKDYEGLVLGLRCPQCHQKLRNLSVEATEDQIRIFAEEGSAQAIEHLKMLDANREANESNDSSN